jgi:competence protein ComEC
LASFSFPSFKIFLLLTLAILLAFLVNLNWLFLLLTLPFFYLIFKKYFSFYYLLFFLAATSYHLLLFKIPPKEKKKEIKFGERMKKRIKEIFHQYLEKENASLVLGIFLGDKKELNRKIKEDFKKTGLYHLLAVSGMHINILAFVLLLFLSILRIPFPYRYLLLIIILFIYAGLCSFRPSVLRAGLMFLFVVLSYFSKRKTLSLNNLFNAGILILLFSPLNLFNISFLLSFLATFGILYFYPLAKSFLKNKNRLLEKYLFEPLLISLSAYLTTAPVIIYSFKVLPTAPIIANLIVLPLVALILPLILLVLFFGFFLPFFALIFSQTLNFLIKILIILTHHFSQIFPLIKLKKEFAFFFSIFLIILIFLGESLYQKKSY